LKPSIEVEAQPEKESLKDAEAEDDDEDEEETGATEAGTSKYNGFQPDKRCSFGQPSPPLLSLVLSIAIWSSRYQEEEEKEKEQQEKEEGPNGTPHHPSLGPVSQQDLSRRRSL
jgi:hypothetical protein